MQEFLKLPLRYFNEVVELSRVSKPKQLLLISLSSVGWPGWKVGSSLQIQNICRECWNNLGVLNFRLRLHDLHEKSKVLSLNVTGYRIVCRPIRFYCSQTYLDIPRTLKNKAIVEFLDSQMIIFLKFFFFKVKMDIRRVVVELWTKHIRNGHKLSISGEQRARLKIGGLS